MDYFLWISQDTLHGIFYGNTENMIIDLPRNLKYYIAYKIILLNDLIILIRNSFVFFIHRFCFTWKFSLIFWKLNRSFFTKKYLNFDSFFLKRAEQICHYFICFRCIWKNFYVFEDYHFSLINYNLSKILIDVCWHFLLGQDCEAQGEAHFLPPKFLIFYWSLNQLLWHLIPRKHFSFIFNWIIKGLRVFLRFHYSSFSLFLF